MESTSNNKIARAAGTVMFAFILSQLAGVARSILVARAFGASRELDAFFAANRVSETLFLLVAGGALGSAFIPQFTGLLAKNEKASAWRLASSLGNLVLLIMTSLALIAAIFAPQIVRYALAPGFVNDPALESLTVNLLRIQLIAAILFGVGGLIVGILNAHHVFFVPALTPAMYQIGLIFGVLVLAPRFGVYGLAWGVVIGATLYLVLQIPTLLKQKGKYTFALGLDNPLVVNVMKLMGPRLLGVAVVQLNFWVNVWIASTLEAGSVAGLNYGFALMLMAQVAIAQSIATAAMPTLSAQFALNKMDEVRASLASTLRGVILLSAPATMGLILLRVPIIEVLYQRGEFTAHSTQLVAWALLWYSAGLVGHSILEILARAFYAMHDTKTPVFVGAGAMALNIIFSFVFVKLFQDLNLLPLGGLALANSLATALEALMLFILMKRRLAEMHIPSILRGLGIALLSAVGMGSALFGWIQYSNTFPAWAQLLGGVLLGGGVYGLLLVIFKVPELNILNKIINKKPYRQDAKV